MRIERTDTVDCDAALGEIVTKAHSFAQNANGCWPMRGWDRMAGLRTAQKTGPPSPEIGPARFFR